MILLMKLKYVIFYVELVSTFSEIACSLQRLVLKYYITDSQGQKIIILYPMKTLVKSTKIDATNNISLNIIQSALLHGFMSTGKQEF